jgi:hypothetical protein
MFNAHTRTSRVNRETTPTLYFFSEHYSVEIKNLKMRIKNVKKDPKEVMKFIAFLAQAEDEIMFTLLTRTMFNFTLHEIARQWPAEFTTILFTALMHEASSNRFFSYIEEKLRLHCPKQGGYIADIISKDKKAIVSFKLGRRLFFEDLERRQLFNKNGSSCKLLNGEEVLYKLCEDIQREIEREIESSNPHLSIFTPPPINNEFLNIQKELYEALSSPEKRGFYDAIVKDTTGKYLLVLSQEENVECILKLIECEPERFVQFMQKAYQSDNSQAILSYISACLPFAVLSHLLTQEMRIFFHEYILANPNGSSLELQWLSFIGELDLAENCNMSVKRP